METSPKMFECESDQVLLSLFAGTEHDATHTGVPELLKLPVLC